jgi:hypothetical protein
LYEAFVDIRREFGLPQKVEIPMQYITLTIEYALKFGAIVYPYPPNLDGKICRKKFRLSIFWEDQRQLRVKLHLRTRI